MSAVLRKDDKPTCAFRDRSGSLQLMQASMADTHTFTCVSPRVKTEGVVMVSIQSDTGLIEGIDSSGGRFEYMAPMAVHAIVPPLGSSHAVTQIELRGSGYIQARTACVFGAARTVVAALVMSSSVLRCNAPSHEEGEVAVEVTGNDGSDISADGQVYRYVADAQVQRVEPSHGPADGGTTMTVWGQHFAYTDQLACVLGSSQRVRARWVSSSMVTCSAPSATPGNVTVGVSNVGKTVCMTTASFRFVAAAADSPTVLPSRGPALGGTLLTLHSARPHGLRAGARCIFKADMQSMQAALNVLNATAFQCIAPAIAPVQSGLWNVSVAEMQAPTQAALFEYMAPMAVHAIVPPLGSSHAVTQIELRGSGYIQERTACVFGAARTVVAALVMSSSVLRCNAPSHEEGEVAVEVTGNDGSDISADGQVYRYVADAQVQRVEPSHGPADGGTTMTVWGQHFAYTDQLACVLGSSQRVRARWVSSSMVTCMTPRGTPGNVTVEVTNTNMLRSGSAVLFRFVAVQGLSTLTPSAGPVRGGTVLTVSGGALKSTTDLMCVFGNDLSRSTLMMQTTESGTCITPMGTAGPVDVLLWGAQGSIDVAGGLRFEYVQDAQILGAVPSAGSTQGGKGVSVLGKHFHPTLTIGCMFGTLAPSSSTAEFRSSSMVVCLSPAHPAGTVNLGLATAVRGHQEYVGHAVYRFVAPPHVEQLEPSEGSMSEGGTMVTVHGDGFLDSEGLLCGYGETSKDSAHMGSARWISTQSVECLIRAGPMGAVTVEVSNDGSVFSEKGLVFERRDSAQLLAVQPSSGPTEGGTRVHLLISGYQFSTVPVCAFGPHRARPLSHSHTHVACILPAHNKREVVSVQLWRAGGIQDSGALSTAVAFAYTAGIPHIDVIMPSRGVASGGALVTLIGRGFEAGARCRFGDILGQGAAEVLSSSVLSCHAAGGVARESVSVEVSNDGTEYSRGHVQFVHDMEFVVKQVVPSYGPVQGGNLLTMHGGPFTADQQQLACRFGQSSVMSAKRTSSSSAVCTVPAGLQGDVQVEVGESGASFSRSGMVYWLTGDASLSRIVPSTGHAAGGTMLSMVGSHLGLPGAKVRCLFCGGAFVVGRFESSTLVVCSSPAQDAGQCTVEVSTDGGLQYTSSGLEYEYRTGSVVQAISPSLGPLLGGTEVRVTGEGLSGVRAECRFGSLEVSQARLSASSTVLWCRSPARSAEGTAAVEVSVDGLPFSADSHRFLYYRPEVVKRVEPSAGSAGQPHVVRVLGEHFLDSHIVCIAGMEHKSSASWRSSTMVECTMPALPIGASDSAGEQQWCGLQRGSGRQCSGV